MDSKRVEWFARVVIGLVFEDVEVAGACYVDGEGTVHYLQEDLCSDLPRDLNAVYEPAAKYLRSRNQGEWITVMTVEDKSLPLFFVSLSRPMRDPEDDPFRDTDHPAEAIIELCWEVGHG